MFVWSLTLTRKTLEKHKSLSYSSVRYNSRVSKEIRSTCIVISDITKAFR